MDEEKKPSLSWRARLARANVNILKVDLLNTEHGVVYRWFFEFTYHPKPGTFKWCKTYYDIKPKLSIPEDDPIKWRYEEYHPEEMAEMVLDEVLALRKELEG